MEPRYSVQDGHVVRAHCPGCGGTLSTFSNRYQGNEYHSIVIDHQGSLSSPGMRSYNRTLYVLMRCGGCGRGALATVHDHGRNDYFLSKFYPFSRETAPLPPAVPEGIVAEYHEAELCASVDAWRAGSALLRSALEKTLAANGYDEGSLHNRIDAAATDGVITAPRKQRAHDNVRDLGNDVLHEEWRVVTQEEYAGAHLYVQRIIEDFYDNHTEVKSVLIKAGRIKLV